jgi:hypothetical protein
METVPKTLVRRKQAQASPNITLKDLTQDTTNTTFLKVREFDAMCVPLTTMKQE